MMPTVDVLSLNFLRTGSYAYSRGFIFGRTDNYGYWWSTSSSSATRSRFLLTFPSAISPQHGEARGFGFAVRCVVREG